MHGADILVVGLHLRWTGVWQRPNHLLTRIAQRIPVVVVEEPLLAARDAMAIAAHDEITVVTPECSARPKDALDERTIETVRQLVGTRSPLVWLYTPMMLALADAFPAAPLIYDKMDELRKFAQADPRIPEREEALLGRAEIVFAGGRSLYRTVQGRTKNARCYPSGVEVEHFARAVTCKPHEVLRAYRDRPIFGYIGVIDERLDLALIAALADARPDATIVLVGPVAKIDEQTLPRRENLVYLGKRGYDELPALLAAFDVALMPFACNEHTENISPTKTLEYLAAGCPVVSTAIPDVVTDHAHVVRIGTDAASFIAYVAQVECDDPERRRRAEAKLEGATWDAIAAAMLRELSNAGIPVFAPLGQAGLSL